MEEQDLLVNNRIFNTKHTLSKKIFDLLVSHQSIMENINLLSYKWLPEEAKSGLWKISKGENYCHFPWMILDFPRFFNQKDVFAFRSMVWWGNYFIFTLHLGGKYANQYLDPLLINYLELAQKDYFISNHINQWHHAIEAPQYIPMDKTNENKIREQVNENGFIKISRKLKLNRIDDFTKTGIDTYRELIFALNPGKK